MAGAFLSIGCFVSALTRNQVIAFVIAAAVCFLFMMSGLELVLAAFRGLGARIPSRPHRVPQLPYPFRGHHQGRARYPRRHLPGIGDGDLPVRQPARYRSQEGRLTVAEWDRRKLGVAGLVLAVILFLAVNIFANGAFRSIQADLTENSLYSVSAGTEKVLADLKEPVTLRFFVSRRLIDLSPGLGTYSQRVLELLQRYVDAVGGQDSPGDHRSQAVLQRGGPRGRVRAAGGAAQRCGRARLFRTRRHQHDRRSGRNRFPAAAARAVPRIRPHPSGPQPRPSRRRRSSGWFPESRSTPIPRTSTSRGAWSSRSSSSSRSRAWGWSPRSPTTSTC